VRQLAMSRSPSLHVSWQRPRLLLNTLFYLK
jgi:hypothetical protein